MRACVARLAVPFFIIALLGAPLEADAKPSRAQIRAAKKAFKSGQRHYKAKRWAKAIVQFQKAHEITGDGLVMGQVALAFEKAGDFARALKSIRVYREALPQSDRGSVDEMIKRYEGEIAAGKSTHLRLPGEPEPPPKPADPPPKPADKPDEKIKDAFSDTKEQPVEAKPRKRFWTWVLAGSAAALGVSALVVGISAQSKYSELEDSCGATGSCSDSDVDSVRSRAIATDVLWGTALAAGIAAGVLYFLEGRGESRGGGSVPEPDEPEDDEEEEEDDLVKRFRIAPMLGGGTVGLGAEIRY